MPDVFHSVDGPPTPATPKKTVRIEPAARPNQLGEFTPRNNEAVLSALMWLSRHQDERGFWSVTGYSNRCEGEVKCLPNPGTDELNTAVTALALQTFLGAGYTHLSKDTYRGICFGDVVKLGVQHLIRIQNPDGSLEDSKHPRFLLVHSIATNALALAYVLTSSAMIRDPAQKAVDFLLASRIPRSGWGYHKTGRADTITTGWALMAIKNSQEGDLKLDNLRRVADEIEEFLHSLTDAETGRTGYRDRGVDGAVIPNRNERHKPLPTCTAIAVLGKICIDPKHRESNVTRRQIEVLMKTMPSDSPGQLDPHHWYWASLAIFAFDGPSGPNWRKWNGAVKTAIFSLMNRNKDRCAHLSWEPTDKWSCEGGRVSTVALHANALLIYYRFPGAFLRTERPLR